MSNTRNPLIDFITCGFCAKVIPEHEGFTFKDELYTYCMDCFDTIMGEKGLPEDMPTF